MIQTIIVIILFLGACFYMGRMAYRNFFGKSSKCEGCAMSHIHHPKLD